MEKFLVPRLGHLAFTASFEDILCNLALCQDHCPKENLLGTTKFASFLPPEIRQSITSENLINFVRRRLDYHLEGLMSDQTKKKYIEKFYKICFDLKEKSIDPWVFLDCVLDESFQELETHAAFPDGEPNLKLISTISENSSELQKLKIDFRSMKNPTSVEKMNPLITSLSSLKHLTSLNLHQMRESHRSALKLIGNSCPLLTHLSISGFCVVANDIFSLIFGELTDQLFLENECAQSLSEFPSSRSIGLMQAPSEILTKFCFTLRHLQLSFGSKMYTDMFYSLAAFILKHLPSLEKMDGHHTSFGVERCQYSTSSLNEAKKRKTVSELRYFEELTRARQFEKSFKELAALRSETGLVNRFTFSGFLSLVSLDCVYLNSVMLQTIPKFCQQLKEVTFFMASSHCAVSSPELVQEDLKAWPKLETITLEEISPEYAKVILKTFASSLKRVTFSSCDQINLMDLLPCRQLESLSILKYSTLEKSTAESASLSPSSFLPHLKLYKSEICLGLRSLWLEGKSELTHVALNCWHTGANAGNHPAYYNIPKMWSKLESLELRNCDGLTLSMLSNIVPQLVKLKELHLPETVAIDDPKLAAKIWEDLRYRPFPVHLYFTNDGVYQCCFSVSESLVPEAASFEESDSEDSDLSEESVMYEASTSSEESDSSEDSDL